MTTIDKEILQTAKADQVSFVLALRDAVGAGNILGALLTTSLQQWDRMTDANTGAHLIKGVGVNTVKTDATYTYIAHIIKQYMMSKGVRATAWTKNTIASENFTNKTISNIIAAHTFEQHYELFKIIATRLIGFDDALVDMAIEPNFRKKAEILVMYLASRFELGEEREELLDRYYYEVGYFEALFTTGGFNPAYFSAKISEASAHFDNVPEDGEPYNFNLFSLLTIG